MESPYEYYQNKLGVKISFLVSDKNVHQKSLHLMCYRSFKKRMDSETCREIQLRPGSFAHSALVQFDSLHPDWQNQLVLVFGAAPQNIRKTLFAKLYAFDTKAFDFYSNYTEGAERRRLTQEKVYEYTYNASVLNTITKIKQQRKAFRKSLNSSCADIWQVISTEVNNFNDVAHTLPVSVDGIRKKHAKYEQKGLAMLVDGRRNNENAKKVDDQLIKLFNAMFSKQNFKPTATDVARMYDSFLDGYTTVINEFTGEEYNPKEFKKLSHSTILSYLGEWENKIATYQLRGGNRQVNMGKFTPHHELELPTFAGSLLSIDDRQPPFWYEKGKRAWFYIGIDIASGCFTAWVWGKSKEGIILEFYRQIVRNYTEWGMNLPDGLECESSLNSSYKETILKEGVLFQNVRIEANNARGKYIERVFGTMRNNKERSSEGWIARPFAKSEANQIGNHDVPIMPYNQLIEERCKDLEDWNNSPHYSDKSITCWQYFKQTQHPDLKPTNWIALLPKLGHKTESSCHVGYVILQGKKRMIAENGTVLFAEALIAKMKRIEGKSVDIYWLDANDGTVLKAVVYQGEEYICELLPIPKYNRAKIEQTPEGLANREIQIKYVASVEAFARTQKQSIEKVLVINNTPTTLNSDFKAPNLKVDRFERRETPVEIIETMDTEDEQTAYTHAANYGAAVKFNKAFEL
jgi:hypothetical protein